MVTTIAAIPPEVRQFFDAMLLSRPLPKGQSSKTLWVVYQYIKKHLWNKCERHKDILDIRKEALEEEFLELYERTIAKEKELDETAKSKGQDGFQVAFYCLPSIDKEGEQIFSRLIRRSSSRKNSSQHWTGV